MNKIDILKKINELVVEILNDEEIVVGLETKASEVEGWDSLRHIVIIGAIEDEFGITIDTKELLTIHNVGDICNIVSNKANA